MKFLGIPYQMRQREYVFGDALLGLISIYLGHLLKMGIKAPSLADILQESGSAAIFFISATMIMLYLVDAYNADLDFRRRYQLLRLWAGVFMTLPFTLMTYSVFPRGWWPPTISFLTAFSFAVLLSGWRALICKISPQPIFKQRILIVGAGQAAHLLTRLIQENPEYRASYQLIGYIDQPRQGNRRKSDTTEDDRLDVQGAPPVLGTGANLLSIVQEHQIELIVVALRSALNEELTRGLLECKSKGVQIEDMPTLYKQLAGKVPILHLSENWLIFGPMFSGVNTISVMVERFVDIFLSMIGLFFSAPIVLIAGIFVKLESSGPMFYLQERLGKNEVPFKIVKLRTMRQDAEAATGAVWSQGTGDPRVTRVGRFLRRSRIDELPQFYNVLRGDMSMIGPRPERDHFIRVLKMKIPFYGLRFSVKPGVTGWAQVSYRYGASEEDAVEKLCYELYAIQEMSPALYLLILMKTVQTVLVRPGS